jgi:Domain of unknown function (DUF4190)
MYSAQTGRRATEFSGQDTSMTDEHDDFDDDFRDSVQPHRGPMILVFGILGVLTFSCPILGIFGIVAWVMGKRDLEQIRRGKMNKEGEGLTKSGYILGIVGTIMFILYSLLIVAYFALIAIMVASK